MNETGCPAWSDALPARWVGEADPALFSAPSERAIRTAGRPMPSSTSRHGGEVRSTIVLRSDPTPVLEWLMRLFTDLARLDRAGESLDRSIAGQIGVIVFLFAIRVMLTHQLGFLTRHVPPPGRADPLRRAIGNAHAHGRKAGRQPSLGPLAPADLSPFRASLARPWI